MVLYLTLQISQADCYNLKDKRKQQWLPQLLHQMPQKNHSLQNQNHGNSLSQDLSLSEKEKLQIFNLTENKYKLYNNKVVSTWQKNKKKKREVRAL